MICLCPDPVGNNICLVCNCEIVPYYGKPRSAAWEKLRKEFILVNPHCAVCETKNNLHVHHKKPFHLFPSLELERSNLVVLCARDHLVFGHYGFWESWNPDIDKDVKIWNKKFKNRTKE